VRSFFLSSARIGLYSYNLKIVRQDEVNHLQEAVERVQKEKRDIEAKTAEQAETCRQLTQANNTLSAKTLRLAEEAANAPVALRRQLDECQENLRKAEEEIQALQTSDNNQRIALMDELNSVQTENSNLRAQLRALKR
jgi:chromosome segregation ATPase